MRTLAVIVATAGGLGYAPLAPGTVGSLAALPLVPALGMVYARSALAYVAMVVAVLAIAVWAAGRADAIFPGHDHGRIVIDEVAGMVAASLFVPATWTAAAVVFVLFRVCDVVKPFPANRIDGRWRGGVGVVADDVVAGLYAGVLSRVLLEAL